MSKRNLMITLFFSMAVLFLCQTGLASTLFNIRFDFEVGQNPQSVAMGDLDGDGALDLAVANGGTPYVSGTVSVLLGNGDGTFQSAVDYGARDRPCSVALGDLDGDEDLDLAVANGMSNNVSVLLGNGDGTFRSAVSYRLRWEVLSVAIGDLDGDGNLDLVVGNGDYYMNNNVSVLLGNGDGTFQSAVSYGVENLPCSVAIGDLDGDGDLDLAVANGDYYMNNNVSVLLGNGDGTFQSAVDYRPARGPHSVAMGDLDGDGALDLDVANYSSDNVSVLLGNGDGTFRSAVNYEAGDGPHSVAIGDLDGDGELDLAVANEWSDNVSVLFGNGDGTFQGAVNYEVGDGPHSVAIGDLDGDGDLDLAVANRESDTVSVLINRFETVYPKGWSMISLPVDPPDKRLDTLFPDAVVVYGYEKGTGYVPVAPDEDLEVGKGYWILFDTPQSYAIKGTEITGYTTPVENGWYMIGGCSLLADKIITSGKIGVIYGYTQGGGYERLLGSEPLKPGKGYWILFSNTSEGAEFTASISASQ